MFLLFYLAFSDCFRFVWVQIGFLFRFGSISIDVLIFCVPHVGRQYFGVREHKM